MTQNDYWFLAECSSLTGIFPLREVTSGSPPLHLLESPVEEVAGLACLLEQRSELQLLSPLA
jgi:hypothetical protein